MRNSKVGDGTVDQQDSHRQIDHAVVLCEKCPEHNAKGGSRGGSQQSYRGKKHCEEQYRRCTLIIWNNEIGEHRDAV